MAKPAVTVICIRTVVLTEEPEASVEGDVALQTGDGQAVPDAPEAVEVGAAAALVSGRRGGARGHHGRLGRVLGHQGAVHRRPGTGESHHRRD